jgi:hypothetical protein
MKRERVIRLEAGNKGRSIDKDMEQEQEQE